MPTNIAFQGINPSFSSSASTHSSTYTMSPADFQAALVQQTNTSQAIKIVIAHDELSYTYNRVLSFRLRKRNN